ncbi:MAG: T9SS type A sorting domain-containing protein [Microscillaceae bacterium]|nr:T9SS type A sorting domain-containing protein [Microscillaceae bacterium]
MKKVLALLLTVCLALPMWLSARTLQDSLLSVEPQPYFSRALNTLEWSAWDAEAKTTFSDAQLTDLYLSFAKNEHRFELNRLLQEELLFSDSRLHVRQIYPNPASSVAYLDYHVIENIQAKITIRNLLGKVVKEYDLIRGERKVRITTTSFDSGIYLYTLSINGKALSSRKLVVKRD